MEDAHVVGRQELHELGVVKGVPLTVKDGGNLVRDVQDFPSNQGHSRGKHFLEQRAESVAPVRLGRGPVLSPTRITLLSPLTQRCPNGILFEKTHQGSTAKEPSCADSLQEPPAQTPGHRAPWGLVWVTGEVGEGPLSLGLWTTDLCQLGSLLGWLLGELESTRSPLPTGPLSSGPSSLGVRLQCVTLPRLPRWLHLHGYLKMQELWEFPSWLSG